MASTISIRKTIPVTSKYYTTGGDVTITLHGIEEINFNIKKSLIKINRPRTPSKQTTEDSDEVDSKVQDLKRITEALTVRGWMEDDSSNTAWEKAWQLRAMITRGGQLTSFTWDDKIFDGTNAMAAHLEEMTITEVTTDTGDLTSGITDVARLQVQATIFFAGDR